MENSDENEGPDNVDLSMESSGNSDFSSTIHMFLIFVVANFDFLLLILNR